MVNNFVNIENFFLPTFTLKTDCLKQNNKHCKVGLTLKSLSRVQLFVTPMDYSPPGSSVSGILQARILEWVAIFFSRGSSRPRDWTHVSYIAGRFFTTEMPGEPIFSGKVGFLLSFTLNMLVSIILDNLAKPRYEVYWWKGDSEIIVCLYQSILSLSLCIYAKQDDPTSGDAIFIVTTIITLSAFTEQLLYART